MKTYQFVVFALIGLLIALALMAGKRKKCGCGGHGANEIAVPVEDDGQ